ncbi:MAG TPA: tetracycline resistance ribosomal protection protein, partial [Clostridiales bacterium UBA8960]|nr:tetracycline resistance ribosomal protection protein [Clostridiales bacterium UBA8960]
MNIGILAHVDAGKTTITEQMLHICGVTKEVGRVDNGNATTDAMALEKARGITIRQTTVTMKYKDKVINLLDTPGHVDFIAEVERSLSVLDVAILAISAREGVQTQTKVIFNALRKMNIPTMIMVNKVDRMGVDLSGVIDEIRNELSASIYMVNDVDGAGTRDVVMRTISSAAYQANVENVAMLDEEIFELACSDESALSDGQPNMLHDAAVTYFIHGSLYPVFFGAALMGVGVEVMLDFIAKLPEPVNEDDLSAVVFKIDRDSCGYRRCFVRIFGGTLVLRESYPVEEEDGSFKILKMDALHGIKPYRRDVAKAGEVV